MRSNSQALWFPNGKRSLTLIDAAVDVVQVQKDLGQEIADHDVIELDSAEDGVGQITRILASRQLLTHLHIIAYINQQGLWLGSTCLNLQNLDAFGWQLQQWGSALAIGAAVVLDGYIGEVGQLDSQFLQQFSLLVGAKVCLFYKNASGSTGSPLRRTSKWRCGPVENPVEPTAAMVCPR